MKNFSIFSKKINEMGETNIGVRLIDMEGFQATGVIDMAYANYKDKSEYPFALIIELSVLELSGGYPTAEESDRLEEIEHGIMNIIRQTQPRLHQIGRVTRKGYRDIFYYLASDEIDSQAIGNYCDTIEIEREIHIELEKDTKWDIVAGLIC